MKQKIALLGYGAIGKAVGWIIDNALGQLADDIGRGRGAARRRLRGAGFRALGGQLLFLPAGPAAGA